MANWATLFRQKTRLPVVPVGVDPRESWFHCERYNARLPRVGCANRYRLSRQRTADGATYQAVTYGGCVNCETGAAHAAGRPTPTPRGPMDDTTISTSTNGASMSNGHAPERTFDPRTCAKCRKKFEPRTARERRCKGCTEAAEKPPARSRPARHKPKPRLTVKPVAAQIGELSNSASRPAKPAQALRPEQIATATELLQLAGYTVESIRTPAGEFLRVT